eukprot:1161361-Pelagomonas_calceolata.AAC.7
MSASWTLPSQKTTTSPLERCTHTSSNVKGRERRGKKPTTAELDCTGLSHTKPQAHLLTHSNTFTLTHAHAFAHV